MHKNENPSMQSFPLLVFVEKHDFYHALMLYDFILFDHSGISQCKACYPNPRGNAKQNQS